MIIVYESKTGFTKRYAEMLAAKTGLKVYPVRQLSKTEKDEIIFLGWLKAGKIQGLNKVRKLNLIAVCGSGTGNAEENSDDAMIKSNKLDNIPFFYVRGGCLPMKELKGMDRFMMSMFAKVLKKSNDKDGKYDEAIDHIENGFDGVKEENLIPVLEWLAKRSS